MNIYIKFMASSRCELFVKAILDRLGILYTEINMGHVNINEALTAWQEKELKISLLDCGLELMEDPKNILVEKLKKLIIQSLYSDDNPKISRSIYLTQHFHHSYSYLASIFVEVTNNSIEQYFIIHKIERVKKMLLIGDLNLSEISFKLNYSSVGHLSKQFKKITNTTPSHFKELHFQNSLAIRA